MAQTKRKRRTTKHRGNAAGVVEARGRTGRKPTAHEKKADASARARERRDERMNKPPSWSSAVNRAAISTIVFCVLLVVLFKQSIGAATALAGVMLLLYIPMGYYTDSLIYKRRQKRKAQAKT
jgi:hypothetical protein